MRSLRPAEAALISSTRVNLNGSKSYPAANLHDGGSRDVFLVELSTNKSTSSVEE